MNDEAWTTPYIDKPASATSELLQFFPESLHEELETIRTQGSPVYVPEWNEREAAMMNALLWNRLHFGNELLQLVFGYGFLQGQLFESDRVGYIEKTKIYQDEQKHRKLNKRKYSDVYI